MQEEVKNYIKRQMLMLERCETHMDRANLLTTIFNAGVHYGCEGTIKGVFVLDSDEVN